MNHDTLQDLVIAWRRGEIAGAEAAAAEAHWAACPACREIWARWELVSRTVLTPAERPDGELFVRGVMARVRRESRPGAHSPLWRWAAAAVLLLSLGVWHGARRPRVSVEARTFAAELMPATYLEAETLDDGVDSAIEKYFL